MAREPFTEPFQLSNFPHRDITATLSEFKIFEINGSVSQRFSNMVSILGLYFKKVFTTIDTFHMASLG